jgi:hypothetical protein
MNVNFGSSSPISQKFTFEGLPEHNRKQTEVLKKAIADLNSTLKLVDSSSPLAGKINTILDDVRLCLDIHNLAAKSSITEPKKQEYLKRLGKLSEKHNKDLDQLAVLVLKLDKSDPVRQSLRDIFFKKQSKGEKDPISELYSKIIDNIISPPPPYPKEKDIKVIGETVPAEKSSQKVAHKTDSLDEKAQALLDREKTVDFEAKKKVLVNRLAELEKFHTLKGESNDLTEDLHALSWHDIRLKFKKKSQRKKIDKQIKALQKEFAKFEKSPELKEWQNVKNMLIEKEQTLNKMKLELEQFPTSREYPKKLKEYLSEKRSFLIDKAVAENKFIELLVNLVFSRGGQVVVKHSSLKLPQYETDLLAKFEGENLHSLIETYQKIDSLEASVDQEIAAEQRKLRR